MYDVYGQREHFQFYPTLSDYIKHIFPGGAPIRKSHYNFTYFCYIKSSSNRIWGSCSAGYEEFCLPRYNAMQRIESQLTFCNNIITSIFKVKDEGDMFLWNLGWLQQTIWCYILEDSTLDFVFNKCLNNVLLLAIQSSKTLKESLCIIIKIKC
jgi:hypothetical protein